jgi:hypothetical protein
MKVYIIDIAAYSLVGTALGLGIYACYLFDKISADLAHDIIGIFR